MDLAHRLLRSLNTEEVQGRVPEVMGPTMEEIAGEGLDSVFACCARLVITGTLLEALCIKIGAPRGDFSIYQLQQLTQSERIETVEGLVLSDGQPSRPRPPSLYEKSQMRCLFILVDQVTATLAAHRRLRDQKVYGACHGGGQGTAETEATKNSTVWDEPQLGGDSAPEEQQSRIRRRKRPRAEKEVGATASGGAQLVTDDGAQGAPPQPRPAAEQSEHPKKKGRLYTTTREGVEVCFSYAKGDEGACCQDPCPQGRAHVCQICLGPHRNEWHRMWSEWKGWKSEDGA